MKSVIRLVSIVFISGMLLIACEKDAPYKKPELEFIEVTSYDVNQGDLMSFRLRVKGNKADIKDSIWIRAFTNQCPGSDFTLAYKLPSFPDLNFNFRLNAFGPGDELVWFINMCPGVDTTRIQFYIRDKEGNIINTVGPDRPILLRNG